MLRRYSQRALRGWGWARAAAARGVGRNWWTNSRGSLTWCLGTPALQVIWCCIPLFLFFFFQLFSKMYFQFFSFLLTCIFISISYLYFSFFPFFFFNSCLVRCLFFTPSISFLLSFFFSSFRLRFLSFPFSFNAHDALAYFAPCVHPWTAVPG